ncbi:predicted protein [Sclerotinia sclerotiorum 1980 UF-70]|uniref:Uncharacterized protein n=1 Tax=Sclerotinia sclerotiorum (strain ATCC 18683 / 1980 / Ss-1) TaxID=665079 RepID=A7F761_SCLS1|nr:predicted protein [Sclerotinia sclerotiorum 1980 UF-70]EDN98582.1 predicted protein [Sclerotinia sclerotiorum 1980 UF-70]
MSKLPRFPRFMTARRSDQVCVSDQVERYLLRRNISKKNLEIEKMRNDAYAMRYDTIQYDAPNCTTHKNIHQLISSCDSP